MIRSLSIAAVVLAAFTPQDRGPKIADIRSPGGSVAVQRGEERLDVRAVGRRIVNGDVYDSDRVETAEGASCDIIFADDSRVTVDASTQIVVEQRALREVTDAGKSIARRVSILAGHITSDIVPSADVQTDFVTPGGTAAIRGTLVDIVVNGLIITVEIDDGTGMWFLPGGDGVLPLSDGSNLNIQVGAESLTIENIGPEAIVGSIGNGSLQLPPGSNVVLHGTPDGILIAGAGGGVMILDPNTGEFVPAPEGTLLPPPDQPMLPPGGEIVPMGEGGLLPPPPPPDGEFSSNFFPPPPNFMPAGDIANSLGTEGAASNSPFIDTFDRPNSLAVGNNIFNGNVWAEFGDWTILNGSAHAVVLGGTTALIATNVGHLQSFDISAAFRVNDSSMEPFLRVNALPDGSNGLMVKFDVGAQTLFVVGPGVSDSASPPFTVPTDVFFRLGLRYDGSLLCGRVEFNGSVHQHCVGSPNDPGDHVAVGAINFNEIDAVVDVGDVQRH